MKTKKFSPLIFIIEDEPMYQRLIESALKRGGLENLKCFSSGEECLMNLTLEPDIVLLDYRLGRMNGVDVLQEIKEYKNDTTVIFLSGQEDIEVVVKAMKLGAYEYIYKDYSAITKIRDSINTVILSLRREREKKLYNKIGKVSLVTLAIFTTIMLIFNAMYPEIFHR